MGNPFRRDEWSHLGPLSAVPVALAVAVAVAVVAGHHMGRTARKAAWLTAAGLAGGAAAASTWPLYSLSALALGAGLACPATLWRGPLLARWLALPPALAVAAIVPFVFWPDACTQSRRPWVRTTYDLTRRRWSPRR